MSLLQSIGRQSSIFFTQDALQVHENLTDYFSSKEGEVKWQFKYVRNMGKE